MTLGVAGSVTLLLVCALIIVILLRILMLVRHQSGKVKELEMRMKAMENMDAEETNTKTEEETNG